MYSVNSLFTFTIFDLILVCTVNGRPGDGINQGTCNPGHICETNGTCTRPCTVNGVRGDGTTRGTCDQGQFCQSDGACTGSRKIKQIS